MTIHTRYFDEHDLRRLGMRKVGTNVRVSELSTVVGLNNVSIGSNVRIDSYCVLLCGRGNLEIGSNVHIEPLSSLVAHGGIQLGDFCTISHGVRLFTATADYGGEYFTNVFPDPKFHQSEIGPIRVEDHVIIGGNSVVMPNVVLHEGAAIGALSFVKASVAAWTICGGNPLRTIGVRARKVLDLAEDLKFPDNPDSYSGA